MRPSQGCLPAASTTCYNQRCGAHDVVEIGVGSPINQRAGQVDVVQIDDPMRSPPSRAARKERRGVRCHAESRSSLGHSHCTERAAPTHNCLPRPRGDTNARGYSHGQLGASACSSSRAKNHHAPDLSVRHEWRLRSLNELSSSCSRRQQLEGASHPSQPHINRLLPLCLRKRLSTSHLSTSACLRHTQAASNAV